jgi:hypothetical protein
MMLLDLIAAFAAGFAGGAIASSMVLRTRQPEDNEAPKLDKELFVVMNEDGEIESGPTLEQAAGRLDQDCVGNLMRGVKIAVRMAPPTVDDGGKVIIANSAGTVTSAKVGTTNTQGEGR